MEVLAGLHQVQYRGEPDEVVALCGDEWMFLEERHHDVLQLMATLHGEAPHGPTVVVMAAVHDQMTDAEDLPEEFQRAKGGGRLGDRELVLDLPAETAPSVAHHADREAAFTVDEADDPLLDTWPFLLIVRTGRIVTGHAT